MHIGDIGSIATAVGVAFAAWQVAAQRTQFRTSFQDDLWRQQRRLLASLPPKLVLEPPVTDDAPGQPIDFSDEELAALYAYFDLCNEQALYAERGRIGPFTWSDWRQSMLSNMQRPGFSAGWELVAAARGAESFTSYRRVLSGEHRLPTRHNLLRRVR